MIFKQVLACLVLAATVSCQIATSVGLQFRIKDDANLPVAGAVLTFDNFPIVLATDAQGEARLPNGNRVTDFPADFEFTVHVIHGSFFPATRTFMSPCICGDVLSVVGAYTIALSPIAPNSPGTPQEPKCGAKRTRIISTKRLPCTKSDQSVACVEYYHGVGVGSVNFTEASGKKVTSTATLSGSIEGEGTGKLLGCGLTVKATGEAGSETSTEVSSEVTIVAAIGAVRLPDDFCGEVCLMVLQLEVKTQAEIYVCTEPHGNAWCNDGPEKSIRSAVGHCVCKFKVPCD